MRHGLENFFFLTKCAFCPYKNQQMFRKTVFMNIWGKKITKHFAKKSFSVFEGAKNITFKHN